MDLTPYDLDNCRVCKKPLDEVARAQAHRRVEPTLCGATECYVADIKARFACCQEAELSNCVCAHSFTCKTHGNTHVGTHD